MFIITVSPILALLSNPNSSKCLAVTIQWTGLLDSRKLPLRRKEQEYTEIHTAIQGYFPSLPACSAQLSSILVQVRDQKLEP